MKPDGNFDFLYFVRSCFEELTLVNFPYSKPYLRQELETLGATFLAADGAVSARGGAGAGATAPPPPAGAPADAVAPPPAPAPAAASAAAAGGGGTDGGRGLALELLLEPGVFRQASEVASQVGFG